MQVETVDELRMLRAKKAPLYSVVYLPFTGFFEKHPERIPRGYGYGRLDDIFTSRAEAEQRFSELKASGMIEDLQLFQTVYDFRGRAERLLREWRTP